MSRLGQVSDRVRWLRNGCRRPVVWAPLAGLAVLTWILAGTITPWPEGRVLLTLTGLGPRGISLSDLVVLAVVGLLSAAWLWTVSSPPRVNARQALGTLERRT